MAREWELKQQMCDIGRRIYQQGFVAANDGNISVRVGEGRYLCTPTMVSKGFLKPEDIAVVDDQGKQISGPKPRTSEILLHLEIYHEMPEINAVAHAHPPHATAFAVAGIDVPSCILPEVEIFIGQVPIAAYETPGNKRFAETILPHLRNNANTILLSNHGAVACDATLEQAYFHLETLDMYCKILLLAKQVGNIRQLPPEKVVELMEFKKRVGIPDPRLDCLSQAKDAGAASECVLGGGDDFLRGFSTRPIPGHATGPDGHGRGQGIANLPSQSGQPQPRPAQTAAPAAPVAPKGLGSSSKTAQDRTAADEQEKLIQMITDRIIEMIGK